MKKGQSKSRPKSRSAVSPTVSVILADIRSSHNVGSIFRTADALGIERVYIAGFTPAPTDKFGRPNKEISKVALGAEKTVAWEVAADPTTLIKKIKKTGAQIVAVEQDKRAIDYKKFKSPASATGSETITKTVFIFGNEVGGLTKKIISLCDVVVHIPMRGQKESLNVSVAFGIALSRIMNL